MYAGTSKSSGAIAKEANDGLGLLSDFGGERCRLSGEGKPSGVPLIFLLNRSKPSSPDALLFRGKLSGVACETLGPARDETVLLRFMPDSVGECSRLTPIDDFRLLLAFVSSSGLDWKGL